MNLKNYTPPQHYKAKMSEKLFDQQDIEAENS